MKDLIGLTPIRYGGVHWEMEKEPNALLLNLADGSERALREAMIAVGRTVSRALEVLVHRIVRASRQHPYGLDMTHRGSVKG